MEDKKMTRSECQAQFLERNPSNWVVTIQLILKFGFIGEFEPPITSVGSDALVAPKPQTFYFLMGKKIVCQEEIGGFPV